jgi:protein O-GlcNAc transferase
MSTCTCNSIDPKQSRLSSSLDDGGVANAPLCDQIPSLLTEAYAAVRTNQTTVVQELLRDEAWTEVIQFVEDNRLCVEAKYMLAKVLLALKQRTEAESLLQEILELEPHPALLRELAHFYAGDARQLSTALKYSQRARELAPNDVWICCSYAHDLIHAGRVDEGFEYMCGAAQAAPDDPFIQANYLWYRHYVPQQDRASFFQAYQAWARRFVPMHLCRDDHLNRPEPRRRLRIGYISPDFCGHPVASTFEPILDGHDRAQVELFGYGNVASPDDTTERLQAKLDQYRDIHGQHPEAIANLIQSDRIDILVALAGHCTGNCLTTLAYRPAPIQVDLGSISTTGMEQIDYRITDEVLDPPDTQAFYVERLVYIPSGFVSFRPPKESPLVEPLPAHSQGGVTFGSFNNHVKINDFTLRLWCRVLNSVPHSQMILKFKAGHDPGVQAFFHERFAHYGVSPDRIHVKGIVPHFEHLRLLSQVDIALDTFPFNGCVTTLESLWMGVPILTLSGTSYVSQVGRNVMTQLGLETFVTRHPDKFVAKARSFAAQPEALASISHALRSLMLDSPLCRPGRLAQELESAYRRMWQTWCRDVAGVSC